MELEKGVLTIVIEGLEWVSESDSRKKTSLMHTDLLKATECFSLFHELETRHACL